MNLTGTHRARYILRAVQAALLLALVPLRAAAQEAEAATELPSRSVVLKKNQNLDIVYPGSGWIYLGETTGSSLLRYAGRKLSADTTMFTLLAQENGSAVLHFFKSDALTGKYIDDYLAVTIEGSSTAADHVTAPSYADVVPPRPTFNAKASSGTDSGRTEFAQLAGQQQESPAQQPPQKQQPAPAAETAQAAAQGKGSKDAATTVIQNTDSAAESTAPATQQQQQPAATESASGGSTGKEDTTSLSSDNILELAQKAYDEKDYQLCLSYLADFLDSSVTKIDEGMYLQAQALEAASPARDIKKSISVYRKLVEQFPESTLWESASERIVYLDRFYFAIR